MALPDDFENFVEGLAPDKISEMQTTVGEIAKKLNKVYYSLDSDASLHMYIVGSIGRGTSIKGVSDLDILFDLPSSVYTKYNNYGENSNGQSALLQEIKDVLSERYPKTKMRGDGQVVVIDFINYTVELVPGFRQSDDSFKYPDTNDGGTWKKTNPLPEIEASQSMALDTDWNFIFLCRMLRAWKNNIGFKFGGLLIDSLVYKFLNENTDFKNIGFDKYFDATKSLFSFLKDLNKEQAYWYALGSNQLVYNCDKGKFITKAKNAYNKISSYTGNESDINDKLQEIFGNEFPVNKTVALSEYAVVAKRTEQFIDQLFAIDIQYDIKIDCEVTQDGYRPTLLRNMLKNNYRLSYNKKLKFEIVESDLQLNLNLCDIYWKVRNVGDEAIRRNQIRGQIIKTNKTIQNETTMFRGAHYVECFIVKNGVCIARDRIEVPIE